MSASQPSDAEFFCFKCQLLKTNITVTSCFDDDHDVRSVRDSRVAAEVQSIRGDVLRAAERVEGERARVQAQLNLGRLLDELSSARRRKFAVLQKNAERLRDVAEHCHRRAAQELDLLYDALESDVRGAVRKADELCEKANSTLAECRQMQAAIGDLSAARSTAHAAALIASPVSELPELKKLLTSLIDEYSHLSSDITNSMQRSVQAVVPECENEAEMESAVGTWFSFNGRSAITEHVSKRGPTEQPPTLARNASKPPSLASGATYNSSAQEKLAKEPLNPLAAPFTIDARNASQNFATVNAPKRPVINVDDQSLGEPNRTDSCSRRSSSAVVDAPHVGTAFSAQQSASLTANWVSGQPASDKWGSTYERIRRSTISSNDKCWDIALTSEGTVLVAAYSAGMIEFGTDGRRVSGWRASCPPNSRTSSGVQDRRSLAPSSGTFGAGQHSSQSDGSGFGRDINDSVFTVDVLSDGRAAVGLTRDKSIVLLTRTGQAAERPGAVSSSNWREETRVPLHAAPWRISVGGLGGIKAAVAHSDFKQSESTHKSQQVAGTSFEVVALQSLCNFKRILIKHALEHSVEAIAMCSECVVVAGARCGPPSMNDKPKQQSMLQWYDLPGGTPIGRYDFREAVLDIAAEWSGRIAYIAVRGRMRSIAVSRDDGCLLVEVLPQPQDDQTLRLSLSRSSRRTSALACLQGDLKTITVYSM